MSDVMSEKSSNILVVDDEPFVRELLSRWIISAGYLCATAEDGDSAAALLEDGKFDLIVSDIMMPRMSGMDLLRIARKTFPDIAVIMVTAVDDRNTALKALELGAYGYVIKPFDKNEILISVANALERRRLTLLSLQYERSLEEKVRERTQDVLNREQSIALHLISALGYRDDETGAHIRRIGLYASVLAEHLEWKGEALHDMGLAAPMHDVGKIGVPDGILLKPGKLTREEFEVMRTHTVIGACILDNPEVPLLQLAREIALSHHEKWDGSGYPQGIAGDAIPEAGRIVAVVDVYDALVHDRVYRPAIPEGEVISMMISEKGRHFDPVILEVFLSQLPQMRRIREQVREESEGYGSASREATANHGLRVAQMCGRRSASSKNVWTKTPMR